MYNVLKTGAYLELVQGENVYDDSDECDRQHHSEREDREDNEVINVETEDAVGQDIAFLD